MVTFAKITFRVNPELTPYDISLVRSFFLFTLFSLYAKLNGVNLVNFGGKGFVCLSTAFLDSFAIVCLLNAMKYISATKAMLIMHCNPILTVILAAVLLKEVISRLDKIALLLMILGCFLIAKHNTHAPADIDNPVIGYTLATVAAVAVAFVAIGLRKISQDIHFIIFPFYFIVGLFIICMTAYCIDRNSINIHKYTKLDLLTSCLSSVGSLGGLIFMSMAFKHANASQLVPLGSFENVCNFCAEYFLLGYNFGLTDLAGAVILSGAFLVPIIGNLKIGSKTGGKNNQS